MFKKLKEHCIRILVGIRPKKKENMSKPKSSTSKMPIILATVILKKSKKLGM